MNLLPTAQLIVSSLHLTQPRFNWPAAVDWPQVVHHADGHSLTPLLYAVWQQAGLLSRLPNDIRARMARAYADNAARNRNIRAELLDVHQILKRANVPHLVLKGWPLVEQLYHDPAERVLYDHDVLVPPERAAVGHQALQAAGFRPLPAKDEWVAKHLTPLWRNNGYQWDGYLFDPDYPRPVELHLRLWEEGWRGLRVHSLFEPWAGSRTCQVAGVPLQVMSGENTLLHLAMHFAGHLVEREARLNQLLDLARLMQQEAESVNWGLAVVQAKAANIERFVYASLWLAHQVFGAPLPPPAVWRQLEAATPRPFQNWLAAYGVTDVLTSDYRQPQPGQDYRLTFLASQSLAEKAGIVRFALLPPVEQLVKKYRLRHRWLGPLFYPVYLAERLWRYAGGLAGRR